MSSSIARQVVQSFARQSGTLASEVALSVREKEVLALVAQGYINKEICRTLGLTEDTVRGYLKHIYEKLHVRSRTEAAMKVLWGKTRVIPASSSGVIAIFRPSNRRLIMNALPVTIALVRRQVKGGGGRSLPVGPCGCKLSGRHFMVGSLRSGYSLRAH